MNILHNHVGFRLYSHKCVIVQISEEEFPVSWKASVVSEDTGHEVASLDPEFSCAVPGWKGRRFLRYEFSRICEEGRYHIVIHTDEGQMAGQSFAISDDVNDILTVSDLVHYFKGQRSSGRWDETDRDLPFFGARTSRVDVHGGWFDASGDYSKYLSHLSYANYLNPQQTPLTVWSLASAAATLQEHEEIGRSLLVERLWEEASWGADFLMRMQDPEGYFYTTVFDVWSKQNEKRMISAFRGKEGVLLESYKSGFRSGGGMAIAALARISRHERQDVPGDGYTSFEYLKAAETGYRHLSEHNCEYLDDGTENIIDCYCALNGALELYRTTGIQWYLSESRRWAERLVSHYDHASGAWFVTPGSDRPFYHASDTGLLLLSLIEYLLTESDGDRRAMTARVILASLISEHERTVTGENPFVCTRQMVKGVGESTARVSFFIPHENESGYWWQGENARLASMAAMLRSAARHLDTIISCCQEDSTMREAVPTVSELRRIADAQIDWIQGCNPFDVCMLQGYGRNNPRYEKHYPNAPGGICNGITGGFEDENDIDFLPSCVEGRGDHLWRWSEQWIPHASWFLLAIVQDLQEQDIS